MSSQQPGSNVFDEFVAHVLSVGDAIFTDGVPEHLDPATGLDELLELPAGQHEGLLWRCFGTDDDVHPSEATTRFWRTRSMDSRDDALLCPSELGAPPCGVGPAGRANRAGVSMFYGAEDEETAMQEVHDSVDERLAIAAWIPRHNPDRPCHSQIWTGPDGICVLDTNVHISPSADWSDFYNALGSRLGLPIGDDPHGYLPTQYAVHRIRQWRNPNEHSPVRRIHGLWYPSAATGGEGRNLVVFDPCRLMVIPSSARWVQNATA